MNRYITLRIISIVLFLLAFYCGYLANNEKILVLQLLIGSPLSTVLAVLSFLTMLVGLMNTDTGFFKFLIICAFIAIAFGALFGLAHNRVKYTTLSNGTYSFIVKEIKYTDNTDFEFYTRQNILVYYKFADSPNPNTYDSEISIVGDEIIIHNCDDILCYDDVVDIDID